MGLPELVELLNLLPKLVLVSELVWVSNTFLFVDLFDSDVDEVTFCIQNQSPFGQRIFSELTDYVILLIRLFFTSNVLHAQLNLCLTNTLDPKFVAAVTG